MKKKVSEISRVFVLILLFSYLLNFVWESFHGAFLYKDMNFDAKKYVRMINYVSIVDSFLILGIYLLVSVMHKEMLWLREMKSRHVYTAFSAGISIAGIIEYRKVFVLKVWTYNQFMPTILGIGISPLFQLGITGLLAYWITRRVLYRSSSR